MQKKRGFAAMDPEKQRQLASLGGKASHKKGTGHEWTSEQAREAGRRGGVASGHVRNARKKRIEEVDAIPREVQSDE